MRLPWRNSKTNTRSIDEVDDLALWLILHGLIELLLWILVRIKLLPHSHHDCVHRKVIFVRKIDFFGATKNSVDLNGENFGDIFNFRGAWTAEINRVVRLSCVAEVFHQVYEIDSFRVTFLFHEFSGFRIFVEIILGVIQSDHTIWAFEYRSSEIACFVVLLPLNVEVLSRGRNTSIH